MKNVQVNVTGGNPNASYTYSTYVLKSNKDFLTQDDFNEPNTKYVIKWNFDLLGAIIVIPENCIIEFDGGSLSNGTLVGNNTILIYYLSKKDILHNVNLEGTFIHNSGVTINKTTNINGYSIITLEEKDNIIEQITKERAIYKIIYDYDLLGLTINIPDDVIILFEGGSINNGTIVLGARNTVNGSAANTRCTNLFIELSLLSHVSGLEMYHPDALEVGKSIILFDYKKVFMKYVRRPLIADYLHVVNIRIDNINFIGGRNDSYYESAEKQRTLWYSGTAIAFINYLSKYASKEGEDGKLKTGYSLGYYDVSVSNCTFWKNLLADIYVDTCYKSWSNGFHFTECVFNGANYPILINRVIDTNPESATYGQDIDHDFVTYSSGGRNWVRYDNGDIGTFNIIDCDIQACSQTHTGIKADNVRNIVCTNTRFWDFYTDIYRVPYLVDLDGKCYGLLIDTVATELSTTKYYNIRKRNKPDGYNAYSWYEYPYTSAHIFIGPNNSSDSLFRITDIFPDCVKENRPVTFDDIYNDIPNGMYYFNPNGYINDLDKYVNICKNWGIDCDTEDTFREYNNTPGALASTHAFIFVINKYGPFCNVLIYPSVTFAGDRDKPRCIYNASFYYSRNALTGVNTNKINTIITKYYSNNYKIIYNNNDKCLSFEYKDSNGNTIKTTELGFDPMCRTGTSNKRPEFKEDKALSNCGFVYYDKTINSYIMFSGNDSENKNKWVRIGTPYLATPYFVNSAEELPKIYPFVPAECYLTDIRKTVRLAQATKNEETGEIIDLWLDENDFHPARSAGINKSDRPTDKLSNWDNGFPFRDRGNGGKNIYFKCDGETYKRWVEYDGILADTKRFGNSSLRPSSTEEIKDLYSGFMYFDTTLNIPIYAKIIINNGTRLVKWIKSDGSSADAKKCGTIEELPNSSDIYNGYVYMLQTKLNNVVTSSTPIYYDNNKWYYSSGELVTIT